MNYKKIFVLFACFSLLVTSFAFTQEFSIENLTAQTDKFSQTILKSLPFNSTIGLNWSDAQIGKIFPSIPPHFGVGISFGATTMPANSIRGLADMFDVNIPNISMGLPLPGYTIEARIGGLFLPFDIGLKYGNLPEIKFGSMLGGMRIDYQLMGADIRYAVFDPDLLPIKVSVGLGINRLEGGVSTKLSTGEMKFDFAGRQLEVDSPRVGLLWETTTLEFKSQISFPLIIVTPYAGFGLGYAWSKAGYQVKSDVLIDGATPDQSDFDQLKQLGVTGINENGFSRIITDSGMTARLFGGISLNIALIKFDLTLMCNLMDSSFGGTFGIRFQL